MIRISRRTAVVGGTALGSSLGAGRARAAGGGTLRIALSKPAGILDPQRYAGVWGVQSMIFEPLVYYGQGGRIEPGLAQSWSFSSDRKVITFKLRPNVTFSDGAPWNAETMEWGLKRWIGPKTKWLTVSNAFEKLVIVDPMTVEMHLNRYVSSALQELSIIRPVRFLSPRSVAADGAYKDPIGTGPWILEKNDGSGAQLVRNDRYWGPKPAAERVSLVVIPDARSRIAAMRAGEIDIAGGAYLSPISPQEAATLQSSGITVVKSEGSNTMVLGFNPERPVFQDERVREAINLCIDRDAICKKLLLGYASPTVNLFPQTIPASGRRLPVPARNVAKARTLLDQAGWKGAPVRSKDGKPLSLELVISEDAVAGSRALSEVLQGQLRDAGIEVRLRLVDHVTRHDDIPARKYDMALFVSNGAPYDPHATLISLFLSTYPGGTDGKMFMDPRLDPFINAAVDSFGDAQAPAYQKVYDWIEQHHAIAAIYHPSRLWAHGKRVKGFRTPATEYDMPFAGITVA